MTILVAVKKNGRVFLGADRITTFGQEYFTDLVNGGKLIRLKNAYLATSGYTLMDNVLEHMHANGHGIMDNKFSSRADVFQFMLELYTELKKQYTLTDTGKDTYAGIYNVFLVVTSTSIYGISNNLTVTEYPHYVAKGAGADYALGCFYALYDTVADGKELARMALEAACHFCIYCREPLDILEVKANDTVNNKQNGLKDHGDGLLTLESSLGAANLIKPVGRILRNGASKNGSVSRNGSAKNGDSRNGASKNGSSTKSHASAARIAATVTGKKTTAKSRSKKTKS